MGDTALGAISLMTASSSSPVTSASQSGSIAELVLEWGHTDDLLLEGTIVITDRVSSLEG